MGAMKRIVKFGAGGLVGAAIGTVAATLFAPQSGSELQRKVHQRLREARVAGAVAQAEKEEELIRRFRGNVDDPSALEEARQQVHQEVAAVVQSIGFDANTAGSLTALNQSPATR